MRELEDTHSGLAFPVAVASSEDKADELCELLEKQNPGYLFWPLIFKEDEIDESLFVNTGR